MTVTNAKAGWSSLCRGNQHYGCGVLRPPRCDCPCHLPKPKVSKPKAATVKPPKPKTVRPPKMRAEPPVCSVCGNRVQRRWLENHMRGHEFVAVRPKKDDAPCCNARRDELGRPPIGFCGPDCVRRPDGDAA